MHKTNYKDAPRKIGKVESTDSKLSNRAGLALILRYIESIGFFGLLDSIVHGIRHNAKGKPVAYIIRQILAYFIDGTMHAISGFDQLCNDAGYAATLEVEQHNLVSSHTVKRFFRKFAVLAKTSMLRTVLNQLFIWRLQVVKPTVIKVDVDTMVMDNDDAVKREGVSPTYKKKKGFQNLQITWMGMVIDAIFRRGTAHSNHGNDVKHAVNRIVSLIRKHYSQDVPIILTADSGFLDEKNFDYFDKKLGILFVCFGKLYDSVTKYVAGCPQEQFDVCTKGVKQWEYVEFGSRLKSWKNVGYLRTIFTRHVCDDNGQMLLAFARPDSVLYTNIGQNQKLTESLKQSGHAEYLCAESIIKIAHDRGKAELANRSLKDFMGTEQLPFKRFGMNAAYYYLMLIGHVLMESYAADVLDDCVPVIDKNCYPTTVRRRVIDFAAVIVKTGHVIRLKISKAMHKLIQGEKIWDRCCGNGLTPIPLLQ